AVIPDHDEHDEPDAKDTGANAILDRVLAETRIDLPGFHHLERHRKCARTQHQREVLRLLQRLAAHGDLAARADGALNDRWTSHHAVIEHDGHVVVDVLRRFLA